METRITTVRDEAALPGRDAVSAALEADMTERPQGRPVFAWQALLLRYLPEPIGPDHSVKRFALR